MRCFEITCVDDRDGEPKGYVARRKQSGGNDPLNEVLWMKGSSSFNDDLDGLVVMLKSGDSPGTEVGVKEFLCRLMVRLSV